MAGGARTQRRWIALGLLAAVAVAVVVLSAIWPGPPAPPASAATPREWAPPAPAPVAAAPPSAPSSPPPPPPPDDPIAAYRERTRYAPSSGRLSSEAVDLLEPNRRYETPRPIEGSLNRGPDGRVTYLLDADRYAYYGDEIVEATLRVRRGDEPLPVTIRRAVAVAESASGPVGEEEALVFRVRGLDPTTEVDLEELFPEHHGTVQLSVVFEWEPGQLEETRLRFFTTPAGGIPAVFTGRDRDFVEDGSLVVEVGIDVLRAGFYRLDANLFDAKGAPLAFGLFKGELARGEGRVPFRFFGLLLRDQGIAGPYQLRDLRGYLFQEAEHPDRLHMRDAAHTHWTDAYELARFSDEEYMSDHKARMLSLLEADRDAGLSVDQPESAGSPEQAAPGPARP